MPIVAATIIPHSPVLLPGLAEPVRKNVAQTTSAIATLAQQLLKLEPDLLLMVTAHAEPTGSSHRLGLLQGPKFSFSFAEFGDLVTTGSVPGAVGFVHHIKEQLETSFPIPFISGDELPYTMGVPLACLGVQFSNLPLAGLQLPKDITWEELRRLSQFLAEHLAQSNKRLVIVATGDLSHTTKTDATECKIFDQVFTNSVRAAEIDTLANLDQKLRERTRECLWAPTLFLATVLQEQYRGAKVLSYEAPAGVGLLVANCELG